MPYAGRLVVCVINVLPQQRLQQQQAATSTAHKTQCPPFGARKKETGILHPPSLTQKTEMERYEKNVHSYNFNSIFDIRYRLAVACYPLPATRCPVPVSQSKNKFTRLLKVSTTS